MFQTHPFYGLVLLLPQLSVYAAPAWGPDELYITLHAPLTKHCVCGSFQRAFILKLFFWAARSVRSSMRKCWRMCRPTLPATWRRWNPFSNSRRRRKGRGSAFWNRPSSPSTGTSMSPTTRGDRRSFVCSDFLRWGFVINAIILWSAWKLCTMSSTKRWCPSMSKRIWNGGRTITAQACLLTGQRFRCVSHIFCTKKVQYPCQ